MGRRTIVALVPLGHYPDFGAEMTDLSSSKTSCQGNFLITSPSTLVLLAFVFLLGWGFGPVSPSASPIAWLWPAAGLSVLLVFRLHSSHCLWGVLGVAVVTTLSSWVGGYGLALAVLLGIANASEASLVTLILTKTNSGRLMLNSVGAALRLLMATVTGALVAGFLAGGAALVFAGGPFGRTWLDVSAAHATSILILLPFALLPPLKVSSFNRFEVVLQVITLVAATVFVFWPGRFLPLAFLPLPIIAWAALRFPTKISFVQILGLAIGVSILSGYGGGPFVQASEIDGTTSLTLQAFLVSIAAFALLASASQNEYRVVNSHLADREEILRGGFVGSRVGLLVVEEFRGGFIVLESNEVATSVIKDESTTTTTSLGATQTLWNGPLATMVLVTASDQLDRFGWQSERSGERSDLEVLIARLSSAAGMRYSIQFVDFSISRRSQAAEDVAHEQGQVATNRMTELTRQKEDFVASASHELRTPITSIIGYVELLEEEELTGFQRASVTTIARNARRLADLVESLLELGRPRDPSTLLMVCDGARVASHVVLSLEPVAERAGVSMAIESDGPVAFAVPPIDLDRLLMNLVGNALKFTPRGGTVVVRTLGNNDTAVVEVTDTGVGMSPEVIEHIFERFYRAPESDAGGIAGTGLGLPLVSGLVTTHHGTVTVDSEPGKGSTFTVTLPRGDMADVPADH